MNTIVQRILTKPYLHKNLTLGKLISFSAIYGIGSLIFFAIQVPLIEIAKMNYLLATAIAGSVGLLIKFVLNGLMTYRKYK
jgi:putative flippase GtrA